MPSAPDLFQFNYAEPRERTMERFAQWLEGALAIGLDQWHRFIVG